MKHIARLSRAALVILALASLTSIATAQRHAGRQMRGGPGIGGVCGSAARLDASISTIEFVLKPSEGQKVSLDELKAAAKLYADAMTAVCAEYPRSLPQRLTASEQRLDTALAGVRKLRPAAEKFYASLNDQQKPEADLLLALPAL